MTAAEAQTRSAGSSPSTAPIYATAAPLYRAAGWRHPIPLPRNRKSPPPGGFTGGSRYTPSGADLQEWITHMSSGNVALAMDRGVLVDGARWDLVAVDADDYVKGGQRKAGADTIARVEAATGASFPATWMTTSRGPGVSGKYLYRVPAGAELVGALPAVELVQWFHRYAVVPPSVNPDSGGTQFEWRAGARPAPGHAGDLVEAFPSPADMAELPAPLVAALARDGARGEPLALTRDEWRAWFAAMPHGMPCTAVRRRFRAAVWAARGRTGVSRYEETRGHTLALLRLAEQGHTGASEALRRLRKVYVESVADRTPEIAAHREYVRLIGRRAVGLVLATPTDPDERMCGCPEGLAALLVATGHPAAAADEYGLPIHGILARIDDLAIRAAVAAALGVTG